MKKAILLKALIVLLALLAPLAATGAGPEDSYWLETLREVHSRFTGKKGTFAHFGDSITVTLAFWTPLLNSRKNAPRELEEAFTIVKEHQRPECWRDWKGPEYGNDGGKTIRWARENISAWLQKLNPEVALLMLGTNDLHQLELDEYQAKTRQVIEKCLANGTVVILSTIPPRSGFVEKSTVFAQAIRSLAEELKLPLVDFHAEVLKRRPGDWDGAMDKFKEFKDYDVPTLIARDGVHPSYPRKYQNDYSEEALSSSGYSLRNALVLLKYAEVVEALRSSPPSRPWFPKAPPLPPPSGEVVEVRDVAGLFEAVENAKPGRTIAVADGRYPLPKTLRIKTDRVTLRSREGKRENVILDGKDNDLGELVAITRAAEVTIADLTIQNARWNGFKIDSETGVQGLTIRNCIVHNVWQRGIKGVKVPEEGREKLRPTGCRVQYCLLYNDHPKDFADDSRDTPQTFDGNYIGGIDIMYAKGWTLSDNVFAGIQGRTRQARGAVFLWNESADCVVERNIIIDCDSGICLGNSSKDEKTRVHAIRCVVRNNFITRAPENGILADYTEGCKILHNTIHDPESRLQRLIRIVHENSGLLVANNLLSGPKIRVESESKIDFKGNLEGDFARRFADPERGDLHLKAPGGEGIDKGAPLSEVAEDIDRTPRGEKPEIGADEVKR
jgi:hypothetical protein